eukprot:685940-Lingulodinium_polyedra.AAC.1
MYACARARVRGRLRSDEAFLRARRPRALQAAVAGCFAGPGPLPRRARQAVDALERVAEGAERPS